MPDVIMPQMGESIVEGTVTKWFKRVGERVERDEPLFEISTDKVDTEIPSPSAGVLAEILVGEGKTVPVNTVVAKIEDGARAAAVPPAVAETAPPPAAPPPPPRPSPPSRGALRAREEAVVESMQEIPTSPLVRRLAKEHNLDLRLIKGAGQGGRITKQDVEAYLAEQKAGTVDADRKSVV